MIKKIIIFTFAGFVFSQAPPSFTLKQINIDRNHNIKIHLANSAGMLLNKDFHFNMVRVGLSMYGYSPFAK